MIACNNSKDENDTFISQKKFNFYFIDEISGSKDCLIYISSISSLFYKLIFILFFFIIYRVHSGTNEFVHSFCESDYCEKLNYKILYRF